MMENFVYCNVQKSENYIHQIRLFKFYLISLPGFSQVTNQQGRGINERDGIFCIIHFQFNSFR